MRTPLFAICLALTVPSVSFAQQFVYVPVRPCAIGAGCAPEVDVYDAVTAGLVARIGLRAGALVGSVAISRDATRVFVVESIPQPGGLPTGVLAVIDTSRNAVTSEIAISPTALIAAGRDTTLVFALVDTSSSLGHSYRIDAIDAATGAVVRSSTPTSPSTLTVSGFAAGPTTDRLFVSGNSFQLTSNSGVNAYDSVTFASVGIALPSGTDIARGGVSVSPDGAILFDTPSTVLLPPGVMGPTPAVTAWDLTAGGVLFQSTASSAGIPGLQSFHTRRAYLSGGLGTIDVFNADTRTKLESIAASGVTSMAISGDDSRLWLAESAINSSQGVLQIVDTTMDATIATLQIAGGIGPIVSTPPGLAPPFGIVDTPGDNVTGVSGTLSVTGWALDDGGVTRVRIYRDAVAGEPLGTQIYIGDATFVNGARPDVQGIFPSYPNASRAGWGLQVLTNMLPNHGTGTYRLTIYADDANGHTTQLGTRTFTSNNATATLPFGTIDTPGQGDTVSGTIINFGWALSPAGTIPFDGSTIDVLIDGASAGHPTFGQARADIDAAFPGFANTGHAVGFFILDTTTLANGVHTIAWIVRDNNGATQGIGSRFFTVANP